MEVAKVRDTTRFVDFGGEERAGFTASHYPADLKLWDRRVGPGMRCAHMAGPNDEHS